MKTHCRSKTSAHCRWTSMKNRCNNPKAHQYRDWGGRGIEVCEEWQHDFVAYETYILSLPNAFKPGYSLDRKDNDGNYKPGNMRWATRSTQSINKRIANNNTSGHKGVYWTKQVSKWRVSISVGGKLKHLGYFFDKDEAIKARQLAEKEYYVDI